MHARSGWTLARAFGLTLGGLVLLLAALFSFLLRGWQASLTESARRFSAHESQRIAELVEASVYRARRVLEGLETRIQLGACRFDDRPALESELLAEVLANTDLSEVTFTRARRAGAGGGESLASQGRWQISVFRPAEQGHARVVARHVVRARAGFVSRVRTLVGSAGLADGQLTTQGPAPDPTGHPTFVTPFSRFYGEALWTDLHYSELDSHLPEALRRVGVSVMKTVEDGQGEFVGVLRAGLLTRKVDELITRENEVNAPHRVFLCDNEGRLVTRGVAGDGLKEQADEALRVPADGLSSEIASALRHPALGRIRADHLEDAGELEAGGERYLVAFRGLAETQGWRVGIVVPESEYLSGLIETRDQLLMVSGAVLAGALLVGGLTLRSVRRGLGEIVVSAQRMAGFDFAPLATRSSFGDVQEVMGSVELAKTALRAMSKYVPVDLVRHLYQTKREPVLGGELIEVSLLFTDIEDFTRLSEALPGNELARLLGLYLEAMTRAIHGAEGVIDKYIGDAVMAIWNAAAPCEGHASKACRAVLACQQAVRALFASAEWGGRAPLVTRFGLHRDRVMVGHFGAPDRMSFTALGDGVNLASRLEGLNKQYGTRVLASEAVYEEAKNAYAFRLLDRVAVKGKTQGVRVYELLGPAHEPTANLQAAQVYEQALAAYWARDFEAALALLAANRDDPPSVVLAARCRRLTAEPPSGDWNGIYVASAK